MNCSYSSSHREQSSPEPAQFINTSLSLTICNALDQYSQWRDSIRRAVETGTTFSSAYPLTPCVDCNEKGQRYYGPVILITNALCYSTADIFAAGFQDHEIGEVLGVEGSTGAGGANVVTHSDLREAFMEVEKAAKEAGKDPPLATQRIACWGPKARDSAHCSCRQAGGYRARGSRRGA